MFPTMYFLAIVSRQNVHGFKNKCCVDEKTTPERTQAQEVIVRFPFADHAPEKRTYADHKCSQNGDFSVQATRMGKGQRNGGACCAWRIGRALLFPTFHAPVLRQCRLLTLFLFRVKYRRYDAVQFEFTGTSKAPKGTGLESDPAGRSALKSRG